MASENIIIEDLPKYLGKDGKIDYWGEEYQDEPLFEYLVKVANDINPQIDPDCPILLPSLAPNRFAARYFEDEIDISMSEEYLKSEIQDPLRAFGIHPSKFWYLILWLKDFVNDGSIDVFTTQKSVKEELVELRDAMYGMKFITTGLDRFSKVAEKSGTLKFKVEGSRGWVTIENKETLFVICYCVQEYIKKIQEGSHYDSHSINFNERETYADGYRYYYFYKFMSDFLRPMKIKDKTIHTSLDKTLLISRLLYVLKMTCDFRFYEEFDKNMDKANFLKNYLRKYNDVQKGLNHNIYWT